MLRILQTGAVVFVVLVASHGLSGQTPDPRPDLRVDEALKEIALLKRTVADQDRRIAGLERTVKTLQTTVLTASPPVMTNRWRTAEGWSAVKIGMSRDQVVEILGEPKSTDAVMDRKTLFYKDAADPIGTVVITDDRVSEVASPRFQISITPQK
jgi:SmpA / OmlA family